MKLVAPVSVMLLIAAPTAYADGFATCDSGPKEKWQSQEKLTSTLKQKGWDVRRIKVDGGCYEVYATDEKGKRVEVYFHPVSLAPVPKGAKKFKG
ncbi:MAG TPA: PepSY domain-containing protein [Burkholderiales bacterium]|nr:PepSY domain-containing protein [Burkholderiales bacterium]